MGHFGDTSASGGFNSTFPAICRAVRSTLGFAQEDLAGQLEVSRKSVQRWERGQAAPDDHAEALLAELCSRLGVFDRAGPDLMSLGVTSWDDVTKALSVARAGRIRPTEPSGVPVIDVASDSSTPTMAADLIGRDRQLIEVRELLTGHRLVTLTGPGGIGKTSLAKAVIAGHRGRSAVSVELAEVREADLVLHEIARQLGRPLSSDAPVRDQVVGALDGVGLLLLDNLEHLPMVAPTVADLVVSCPNLHVLATSRSPLHLAGETLYPIQPLDADGPDSPACLLFALRASQAGVPLTDSERSSPTIALLCRQLDGNPLAIELAASRLRLLPLEDLCHRLQRTLSLLGNGPRTRPDRHRSLEACIGWSLDLLAEGARRLLRALAPFVGGFTLPAAEAVGGDGTLADLSDLVDAGLVRRLGTRYVMSEPVRELVWSTSERAGMKPTGWEGSRWSTHGPDSAGPPGPDARFIGWACAEAERIDGAMRGPSVTVLQADFEQEIPNFRIALSLAGLARDGPAAHRLALALTGGWDTRSMLSEARRAIELTLGVPGAHEVARAALQNWLGYFAALQGDFDAAARHAGAALNTWNRLGIDAGTGYACLVLGRIAAELGDIERAQALLVRSEEALTAAGDQWGLARPVNALGELARQKGDLATAFEHHSRAEAICRALGDDGSLPSILADLANLAADMDQGDIALIHATEALTIARRLGNKVGEATALDALGRAQLALRQPTTALATWRNADALRADLHHPVERRDRPALDRDRRAAETAPVHEDLGPE